jgi:Asp-tRNA(Asn)/Glu-tRNA(Gln) amidotransferase C subunit
MSEQMETDQARLLKLARIEELAAGVEIRWRRAGQITRVEEAIRELLLEIRRPAVSVTKPRQAREDNSQRT